MEEKINTSMDIESPIFLKLKKYLTDKSKYSPNVFSKTPQSLSKFPTIVVKETNNIEDSNYTTLDRNEFVNRITDTIDIYTKDMVVDGKKISSKIIMNELKYLIFAFYQAWGFTRTQATEADYLNYEIDRFIIIESCSLNSWNRKINL